MKTSLRASLEERSSGNSPNVTEQVAFRLHDLEITSKALVMHFFKEKTVIPLKEIASYDLKWYLHDPIFAKKYWFLELTVDLQNGQEQSWPIAVVKFNYLNDEHERREHIQTKIADAISLALSSRRAARLRKK
jgi:hypothetical protein